jgi:hypothetical protein
MSVILGQRPLASGLDAATHAIRRAQDRFATGAAEVARQGAILSSSSSRRTESAKAIREPSLPAQTPPNPGPPGGAQPGDLAQAIVAEKLASHEVAMNVKTVQAFDEMLEALTRLKKPAEPTPEQK